MRSELTVTTALVGVLATSAGASASDVARYAIPGQTVSEFRVSLGTTKIAFRSSSSLEPTDRTSPDVSAGPAIGGVRVLVRVYDAGAVPYADLSRALRTASDVLNAAGIDIIWVDCGHDGSGRCAAPIVHDELAVRFVRVPAESPSRGNLSLGYSLINTEAAAGTLATVYVNRVQWLASQTRSDAIRILGLAVAHELGHLLLGTNTHSPSGLMRAVWSRSELQKNDPADWVFTSAQGVAMEQALHHRDDQTTAHVNWSH